MLFIKGQILESVHGEVSELRLRRKLDVTLTLIANVTELT
jgi:hypothetical protein